MEIFFVEKMQKYIKNIPQKNASDVLKTIKELENKTYEEIISSKRIITLSEKVPTLYAYNISKTKYIVLGFKEKETIIILDVIKLIPKKEIEFLAPDSGN